jgi:hypothetical protein
LYAGGDGPYKPDRTAAVAVLDFENDRLSGGFLSLFAGVFWFRENGVSGPQNQKEPSQ